MNVGLFWFFIQAWAEKAAISAILFQAMKSIFLSSSPGPFLVFGWCAF
jgi:hypothetical protein